MPRKSPGPPCIVCQKPSVARHLCETHYSRWRHHGDAFKVTRPDDWGERNKHPLNQAWRWTTRVAEGRVERWDDLYAFIEDVGERPSETHKLKRLNPRKPFGPDNFFWQDHSSLPEEMPDRKKKSEYQKMWRAKNPLRSKGYDLKKAHGLSLEAYAEMLVAQNAVCAICQKKDKHRSLAVDHCHTTGKVRGLLCTPCNQSLGKMGDSVDRLQSAIRYLEASR